MTYSPAGQTAGFILNDLDSGAAINTFTATFQLVAGRHQRHPADGFSFNYASDVPDGTINEEGAGTGLTVEFDTYTNSTSDWLALM